MLDNPIWNALITEHAALSLGGQHARRYIPEIGPLSGIAGQALECYDTLRELAANGAVVLFSVEPFRLPSGWKCVREGPLVQMVRTAESFTEAGAPNLKLSPSTFDPREGITQRQLTAADAPAMVALAELTEPGPFRIRTVELGNFFGIFHGNSLVAMAGKRMHLPGMVEVSGVCTHPEARGRGYAAHLMSTVIDEIESEGKTAFLHALAENPAIRIYQHLGFRLRQNFHFAVILPDN